MWCQRCGIIWQGGSWFLLNWKWFEATSCYLSVQLSLRNSKLAMKLIVEISKDDSTQDQWLCSSWFEILSIHYSYVFSFRKPLKAFQELLYPELSLQYDREETGGKEGKEELEIVWISYVGVILSIIFVLDLLLVIFYCKCIMNHQNN